MDLPTVAIRLAQASLGVSVDGVLGPVTVAAARAKAAGFAGAAAVVAYLQAKAKAAGLDPGPVDGLWGPLTDQAVAEMVDVSAATWVDDRTPDASVANAGTFPMETRSQSELVAFYGPPGRSDGSYRPPMVKVPLPWTMKIAWDLKYTRDFLWCHERAAPSLTRVLDRIRQTHTDAQISDLGIDLFGGDYNPRLMKGASRSSLHSWGIAYDFDPARNRLHANGSQARLGQPDAVPFWKAWEAEGWCPLGRARNYDFMHVQAASRAY